MATLRPNSDTVWVYVDPRRQSDDPEHVTVFATPEAAEAWFRDNGYPDGFTFKRQILETSRRGSEAGRGWPLNDLGHRARLDLTRLSPVAAFTLDDGGSISFRA